MRLAGGGDGGIGALVAREAAALSDRLKAAQINVVRPVDVQRASALVRALYDPAHPVDESANESPRTAWPLQSIAEPSYLQVNGGWCTAVAWVKRWPMRGGAVNFLAPLLVQTPGLVRTVAVTFALVPTDKAMSEALGDLTVDEAESRRKSRGGKVDDPRDRRQKTQAEIRAEDVADGASGVGSSDTSRSPDRNRTRWRRTRDGCCVPPPAATSSWSGATRSTPVPAGRAAVLSRGRLMAARIEPRQDCVQCAKETEKANQRLATQEAKLAAILDRGAAERRQHARPLRPRRRVSVLGEFTRRWDARRPAIATSSTQAGALFLAKADPGLGVRGVLLGKELYSGGGVVYDPFEMYGDLLPGPNGFVQGDVGVGKSVFGKAYGTRQIRMGRQLAVIDNKDQAGRGEWTPIAHALGLEPVRFSRRGGICLNPLDPRIARLDGASDLPDDQVGQDALLRTIAEVALGRRLTPEEGYALRCAHDGAVLLAAARDMREATLPLVVEALFAPAAKSAEFARTTVERLVEDGRKVALELDRMCRGDLAGLIDGPTSLNVDLDAPLLVFDLSGLDGESDALPVVMAVIGTFLQSVWVRPDGVRRVLLVEEGWHVVGNLPTARLFRRFCKLARGLGLQVLVVVHRLTDLTAAGGAAADAALALAKEAHTHVLFAMKPDEARAAVATLGLPAEVGKVLPLLPRGCAVLVVGRRIQVVQIVLTGLEEQLFFTDAAMTG